MRSLITPLNACAWAVLSFLSVNAHYRHSSQYLQQGEIVVDVLKSEVRQLPESSPEAEKQRTCNHVGFDVESIGFEVIGVIGAME